MILNNFEEIEISGQKYKLKYNFRALAAVERDLGKDYVFKLPELMSKGDLPSFTSIFTLFKHGFVEGNPKTAGWKDDEVTEFFEAAVCDYSLIQVSGLCLKALRTAGVLELKPKKNLFPKPPEADKPEANQDKPSAV